jgi:hypothetical protein
MVSSVLAQAILNNDGPDLVGSFRKGQEISRQSKVKELSGQALKGNEGALEELSGLDPEIAYGLGETLRARSAKDINDFIRDARIGLDQLKNGDVQGAIAFGYQRRDSIRQRGGDTTQTDNYISLLESGDIESAMQGLQGLVGSIDEAKKPSGQQESEFQAEALIGAINPSTNKPFTRDEALQEIVLRKSGITARSGMSAQERIASNSTTTQQVADSQAIIKGASSSASERAKLNTQLELKPGVEAAVTAAKGQASLSTDIVKGSFEGIGKARKSIGNINRAIQAIDDGANTGAIQRFFPSITTASIELDQLRNELGLDVVGAVTFGALSKGELDLALSTALPDKLEGPALRDFLVRKKEAQNKTILNMREAIQFLSKPGATVADFVQSKGSAIDDTPQKTISVDF